MRSATSSLLLVAILACGSAAPALADDGEGSARFGAAFSVGVPTGELADNIDAGFGLDLNAAWAPRGGPLGLRLDAWGVFYGSESFHVTHSPEFARVPLEGETTNWLGGLTVGPQLMVRSGPVRPYAYGFAGLGYFATESEIRGEGDFEPFATATNHDDATFAWGGGAGVLVPFGRHWGLDVGVRYVVNGEATYLTEGDLVEDGEGGVLLFPRRTEANLLEVRVGVTWMP